MIKIILTTLFFGFSISFSFSQQRQFTLEGRAGTLYYLVKSSGNITVNQGPDFDEGLLLGYKTNKYLEIKSGFTIFSKKFTYHYTYSTPPPSGSYEIKNHISIDYLRIPVQFSVSLIEKGKLSIYAVPGFSIGHAFYWRREAELYNGTKASGFSGLTYYYHDPFYLEFEMNVRYSLSERLTLNLLPWYRYMYLDDFLYVPNSYYIALSHKQIGLSAGIIYHFNFIKTGNHPQS